MLNKNRFVLLIQQGDAAKRDAVYAGIGFVIGDKVSDKKNLSDVKITAKNLAYELAELAIVEKDRLFNMINNIAVLKYEQKHSGENGYTNVDSVSEAIGYGKYFTEETIKNIDTNIDLFNNAVADTYLWLQELED